MPVTVTVPTIDEFNALAAQVAGVVTGVANIAAAQAIQDTAVGKLGARLALLEAGVTPPPLPDPVGAPGNVTNLAVSAVTPTSVTLSVPQVADGAGQPANYEIRYAPSPISWGSAGGVIAVPGVAPIGAVRAVTVPGLLPGTAYQFQVVAYRGTLNVDAVFGDLSNVASGTTGLVTVPPPAVGGGAGPNAPTAWTTVIDSDLNAVPGGGWNSSGPRLVADPTAPLSPPGVAEYLYPAGRQGGQGVGSLWRPWPAGMDSHYIAYTFKLSKPFDNRFGFKQWYPGPNGPGYYFMVVEGAAGPPYDLRIEGPVGVTNNRSNVQRAQVLEDTWHRTEILFESKTRLRFWLDTWDAVNRKWLGAKLCGDSDAPNGVKVDWGIVGVEEARLDSTWAGVSNTVAFTSRWWADHIFMSRP